MALLSRSFDPTVRTHSGYQVADFIHYEAAEREMCELEMRVRVADAKAKEHSNAVDQITEAICTQLLGNRVPSSKFKLLT
jgi:hypothetical protein